MEPCSYDLDPEAGNWIPGEAEEAVAAQRGKYGLCFTCERAGERIELRRARLRPRVRSARAASSLSACRRARHCRVQAFAVAWAPGPRPAWKEGVRDRAPSSLDRARRAEREALDPGAQRSRAGYVGLLRLHAHRGARPGAGRPARDSSPLGGASAVTSAGPPDHPSPPMRAGSPHPPERNAMKSQTPAPDASVLTNATDDSAERTLHIGEPAMPPGCSTPPARATTARSSAAARSARQPPTTTRGRPGRQALTVRARRASRPGTAGR